jgi:hypothetical protein
MTYFRDVLFKEVKFMFIFIELDQICKFLFFQYFLN